MRRKMGKFAGLPVVMLGAVLFFAGQAYADADIDLVDTEGAPGAVVPLDAILVGSVGELIAGTQNDITFVANAEIAGRWNDDDGIVEPDCDVNSSIRKNDTQFAFLPAECATGTSPEDVNTDNCTGVRALVLSLSNTNPIDGTDPPGVRIYTCNVTLGSGATGTVTVPCSNSGASNPDGDPITATCQNGLIEIVTATETPTATVPPATSTPTNTSAVTNTPVNTATRTRGPSDEDDDGCQAAAPVSSHTGWLLFAPAAILLWSRRRSR